MTNETTAAAAAAGVLAFLLLLALAGLLIDRRPRRVVGEGVVPVVVTADLPARPDDPWAEIEPTDDGRFEVVLYVPADGWGMPRDRRLSPLPPPLTARRIVRGRDGAERVARDWVAEARVTREVRRRRRAQRWTVR
jgi:hypothetical protein